MPKFLDTLKIPCSGGTTQNDSFMEFPTPSLMSSSTTSQYALVNGMNGKMRWQSCQLPKSINTPYNTDTKEGPTIYCPTTSGTYHQFLTSSGTSGSGPTWATLPSTVFNTNYPGSDNKALKGSFTFSDKLLGVGTSTQALYPSIYKIHLYGGIMFGSSARAELNQDIWIPETDIKSDLTTLNFYTFGKYTSSSNTNVAYIEISVTIQDYPQGVASYAGFYVSDSTAKATVPGGSSTSSITPTVLSITRFY